MNDEFFKQVKKFNFPKYKNAREFYGEEDYQKVREMAREIDKRLAEKAEIKRLKHIKVQKDNEL